MKLLKIIESEQVYAGSSNSCYEAYEKVADSNSGLGFTMFFGFVTIFLTPLGSIGFLIGQDRAVQTICGSNADYDAAKLQYCATHPCHYACQEKK